MAEQKLHWLADFPAVTTETWMAKITTDLKGADFNKKLVWRTDEGFNVMPFYRNEDLKALQTTDSAPGQFPFVRGTKTDNDWRVRQNIDASDAKAANAKAREILTKGVDALGLKLNKQALDEKYITTLLDGINAEKTELNFHVCINCTEQLINLLANYFKKKGYKTENLSGSIDCDPMNRMLLKGKKLTREQVTTKVVGAVQAAATLLPHYRVLTVNSVSLNNCGAFCTQELGYALAWGNQYMEMLTEAGIDAATAGKAIKFHMGIGGNYFMEIAKFRAARMLWAMIVRQYEPICNCGADCKCEKVDGKYCPCAMKMNVCAETSRFNMTIFDAYVNLLRSQTEVMSAALACVDEIVVTPFDITYQQPDDFSERIARNQQLLLKEEAHFSKTIDPAAGSYYIENLTANIAEHAWKRFLELQDAGGFFAAVESGRIQEDMKTTAEKRLKNVSQRRETLLGSNQFPNFNETAHEKIKETGSCACGCNENIGGLETLPTVRAAQEFEALRLKTEAAAYRPKAFMLTIGNLAMRQARAQFSCNFLACAGYQVIDNLGFETLEAGVEAARKAKADIIVLCSSDDEYADFAPKAWELVKGKEIFVVAGAPACMEDLQKLGIEHFIHVRCNVLETLKEFNKKLNIK